MQKSHNKNNAKPDATEKSSDPELNNSLKQTEALFCATSHPTFRYITEIKQSVLDKITTTNGKCMLGLLNYYKPCGKKPKTSHSDTTSYIITPVCAINWHCEQCVKQPLKCEPEKQA